MRQHAKSFSQIILLILLKIPWGKYYYYLHFALEETEAQKGRGKSPNCYLALTCWSQTFTWVCFIRGVSQPQHYWHFDSKYSLPLGLPTGHLTASLTSIHWLPVAPPSLNCDTKNALESVKCPLAANLPPVENHYLENHYSAWVQCCLSPLLFAPCQSHVLHVEFSSFCLNISFSNIKSLPGFYDSFHSFFKKAESSP